jgi:hypothetical protein
MLFAERNSRGLFFLIIVFFLSCTPDRHINAQQVTTERNIVYVARLIENTPLFNAFVETVRSAPSRPIIVQRGETLEGLIAREYGADARTSPNAYSLFRNEVTARNVSLLNPDIVRAGQTLQIPNVGWAPVILQPQRFRPPLYSIPGETTASITSRPTDIIFPCRVTGAQSARAALCDELSGRDGWQGPGSSQVRSLSDTMRFTTAGGSQGRSFVLEPVTEEVAKPRLEMDRKLIPLISRVQIEFSAGERAQLEEKPLLLPSDIATVEAALQRQRAASPILLILDDSWPDDDSFRHSRDFIINVFDALKRRWNLKLRDIPEETKKAQSTKLVNARVDANLRPEIQHARLVQDSLAPLVALDRNQATPAVRIIYLPILLTQLHSKELLRPILALYVAVKSLGDLTKPFEGEIGEAEYELADRVLGQLGDKLGDSVASQHLLIEALLYFAGRAADFPTQPVYVSTSWTFLGYTLPFSFYPRHYGFFVAASGNGCADPCSREIYDPPVVRFAELSRGKDRHFIAVMNLSNEGKPICNTVMVPSRRPVLGFGFTGFVRDDVCGTSFSTPRVAWLLAARHAVFPDIPGSTAKDPARWSEDYIEFLPSFRDPTIENWGSIRLDLQRLFR